MSDINPNSKNQAKTNELSPNESLGGKNPQTEIHSDTNKNHPGNSYFL